MQHTQTPSPGQGFNIAKFGKAKQLSTVGKVVIVGHVSKHMKPGQLSGSDFSGNT